MRILLINQTWFTKELRDMGHEVYSCGASPHLDITLPSPVVHIDQLLHALPNGFRPDRIVWLDNSAPMGIIGVEDCEIPSLFYSIDTHHHYATHSHVATCFDHALVAHKDYISELTQYGTPTTWLPLWASEYVESSSAKKYGAVFVGTLNRQLNPERVDFFERLQQIVPIEVLTGHFPSIFPFAEIVVNQTVKGDLNFRVFEAMMCGSLLLTEEAGNGLLEIFKDGAHLVTYTRGDAEGAAQKIKDLLANPSRMRSIANAGREEILAKHLPIHRAKTIEDILTKLNRRERPASRHYGAALSLISMSCLIEELNRAIACEITRLSFEAVRRGLLENARPNSMQSAFIMKICLKHDALTKQSDGAKLIKQFADTFPESQLFSLLRIRALLNEGKMSEASRHAQELATTTPLEVTFSTAEQTAQCLLE
jgi:hypothetical protein